MIIQRITSLFFMTVIVSCASSGNKSSKDLDEITNSDFKTKKALRYNESADKIIFKGKYKTAFNESLELVNRYELDKSDKDVITQINNVCLNGDINEGLSIAKKYRDSYRELPSYWTSLGTCHLLSKKYRLALLYFNKSFEFKRNYAPALNNLAVMYWLKDEKQKTEAALLKAIKHNPYAATPRLNLAKLYLSYNLYNPALDQLSVLDRTTSNSTELNALLFTAYLMKGDLRTSQVFIKKLPEDAFARPQVGINAAYYSLLIGKKNVAKEILSKVDEDSLGAWKNQYKSLAKELK